MDLESGIDELKARLEVLLGARPEAPLDVSQKERSREEAERVARKERVALAGGQLLTAAFTFLGQMLPRPAAGGNGGGAGDGAADGKGDEARTDGAGGAANLIKDRFAECLERDEQGRPRLTVTLPDEAALECPGRLDRGSPGKPGGGGVKAGARRSRSELPAHPVLNGSREGRPVRG